MKKLLLIIICNLLLSSAGIAQWQSANNGLYGGYIMELTIDPITNYLYAGTSYGGVFLSTNNGASWTPVNIGISGDALDVQSISISGTNIFAGTNGGVLLSTNNGSSWTAVNKGFISDVFEVFSIAFSGNNIFVGTSGGVGKCKF